jgi:predicted membrane protein
MENFASQQTANEADYIYNTSVFGGFKRIIQSKNFKGGEITLIFGGIELDLSFAGLTAPAAIDITQAFGEIKLFIPSDWQLVDDITHFLSVVKDHRFLPANAIPDNNKKLILRGFSALAAVEVLPARVANI